jgi:hypothetical protein
MANQFNLTIIVNDIRCCSSDCINDQYWIMKRLVFLEICLKLLSNCHNLKHNEDDCLVQLDHSQIVD